MASYDVSKLILPNGDECDLKDAEAREDLDNAKAKLDGMGMVSYGTCSTSADAQVKVVTISNNNWQLKIGSIIGVKYSNTNTYNATTSAPVKLNVNGTGAKQIYYSGSATPTGTSTTAFGYANQYRYYMYDGTYWVFMGLSYHDNTFPSAYCSTTSGTAAKTASCSGYQLLTKSYLHIVVTNANTSANALTLNVNGKGAKPIYINGAASSSSNYTLPAGSYIIYYDGTNYYFRTDGKLTADITGTASGALSLAGGTLTGDLTRKANDVDASKADNGVTSTKWPTTFSITDSANRILTRKEAAIYANGNIDAFWYVRNYDTSGQMVAQKGIRLSIDKTGALTYTFSDPDKARSALGITPTNIGAKPTQTDVSDPTASGTAVAFIDSITQNANGVITPTKKTVRSASQSESGLMSATDKAKLDGIIIMDSTTRTIVDGTSTVNVSGLTADHVVARWQFSGNYTDNYPPADITVTTSNGSYTITASNLMSEGITMQPIFIKP